MIRASSKQQAASGLDALPRLDDAKSLFAPYLKAAPATLRRVYLKLALKYHPDKWPLEQHRAATELFQAISSFYEKLLKPHGRTLMKRVRSAVSAAAELGDVEELRKLLEMNPARANEEEDDYIFPLMFAAKAGNVEAMEVLLSYGAELQRETPLGWSALFFAALNDQSAAVRFLVDRGMNVSQHVLMLAAYTGSAAGLQALLECSSEDVAQLRTDNSIWIGEAGRTLLHLACEGMCQLKRDRPESYADCIDQLLRLGVPVNALESKRGRTCLQKFIADGEWHEHGFEHSPSHLRTVRLLCENGADLHLQDSTQQSALSLAVSLGLTRVLQAMQEGSALAARSAL